MARVEIVHKCVMIAREVARKKSMARETGRSVFIKRCYGTYRLIGVEVSKRQRTCRDMFAEAQKLASRDLASWNKKRHWEREAKRHKIRGAHRMAVSYYYRLLKENEGRVEEVMENRNREEMVVWRENVDRTRCEMLRGESAWKEKSGRGKRYYRRRREKERDMVNGVIVQGRSLAFSDDVGWSLRQTGEEICRWIWEMEWLSKAGALVWR